jgi:hypothetical protein
MSKVKRARRKVQSEESEKKGGSSEALKAIKGGEEKCS